MAEGGERDLDFKPQAHQDSSCESYQNPSSAIANGEAHSAIYQAPLI
jgi:hypothetical protein